MFVSEYWKEADCAPDIIATAKSIAGSVPLSSVTARKEIFDGINTGIIGGTFGGNALACASALKVIEIMEKDKLCERALKIADKCNKVFEIWKDKYEAIGDVRGIGVMMGIEFVKNKETKEPYPELVKSIIEECALSGLLIESAGTYGNVIRFLCTLVVTDEQLKARFEILENSIKEFIQKRK